MPASISPFCPSSSSAGKGGESAAAATAALLAVYACVVEAAVGALEKGVSLLVLVPMSSMEVEALVQEKLAFCWGAMEAEAAVVWSVWAVL